MSIKKITVRLILAGDASHLLSILMQAVVDIISSLRTISGPSVYSVRITVVIASLTPFMGSLAESMEILPKL
jgi:hypothetical protein